MSVDGAVDGAVAFARSCTCSGKSGQLQDSMEYSTMLVRENPLLYYYYNCYNCYNGRGPELFETFDRSARYYVLYRTMA